MYSWANISQSIYHHDHGSIRLIAFRTTWNAKEIEIKAHKAIKWVTIGELQGHDFAPAVSGAAKMV